MKKSAVLFGLLACLCMASGCGKTLTPQEAETAIRSELKNMPLSMGVKMKKLDRLEIINIVNSEEALSTPGLSDVLQVTTMKDLENVSGTKIFFVLVDMEGSAAVGIANALQPGARGTVPIEGNAWFLMTRDKNDHIQAQMITRPTLDEEDDEEYEEDDEYEEEEEEEE